jgi:NAD(P)-dependent dehydrogenase (short-subunit alcohol dehydrogenase family)
LVSQRHAGKVALVTGGASGLGEACSRRFAAEGARVAVLDRDVARGERVAAELGSAAMFVAVDVSNYALVEAAVAKVVQRFGRLDAAVNSAGVPGAIGALADYPLDAWDQLIAVNLTGVFYSMRAELRQMIAQGSGAIVNVSSTNAIVTFPLIPAYVAAKHGVVGLTKAAALENGPAGIRVNAVAPTVVKTPMSLPTMPDEVWAALTPQHALKRLPEPDEIAAAVAFLASDEASYITGTLQVVDGGYTLS